MSADTQTWSVDRWTERQAVRPVLTWGRSCFYFSASFQLFCGFPRTPGVQASSFHLHPVLQALQLRCEVPQGPLLTLCHRSSWVKLEGPPEESRPRRIKANVLRDSGGDKGPRTQRAPRRCSSGSSWGWGLRDPRLTMAEHEWMNG